LPCASANQSGHQPEHQNLSRQHKIVSDGSFYSTPVAVDNIFLSLECRIQGCIKPARNAAFMRQQHENREKLPAKAGVPPQARLGWRA
jgi:hypothetical protein